MEAEKTLIMIALLLTSLTLLADVSIGKASVSSQFSNSVSASAAASHGDWSQTYGGSSDEFAYSVVQTSDGGYALAGFTDSSGAGGNDFYLVKVDSTGASSSSPGLNWSSVEGYVIIAAIVIIIVAALLIMSRIGGRKGKI